MKAKGRRGKGASRQAGKKPAARTKAPKLRGPRPPRRFRPHTFLDHPADVGFIARGKTLEELFAAAAGALCDYGWELRRVRARETVEIRARAATLEDLLYSWLSEVIFLSDAERRVFKRFTLSRVGRISDAQAIAGAGEPGLWEARGTGRGERFVKRRHRARTYIKAVTYHQLAVRQGPGGWQATVYLDV